ncbi:hypothetical protein [Streptomyces nogalater]|uniref:Uncharacterized protein n=1 Tax=Streptomyces nogalater TaxID=38314 RepID=A0ABW0WKK0_STRNO
MVKIRLAGENGRRSLATLITPGQARDGPQMIPFYGTGTVATLRLRLR